jgi:hypothetical protein
VPVEFKDPESNKETREATESDSESSEIKEEDSNWIEFAKSLEEPALGWTIADGAIWL